MSAQPERPDADAEQTASSSEEDKGKGQEAAEEVVNSDRSAEPVDLRAQADENWDRYLRAAAELENVRKRAVRDVENARKFALERFANELLAVRDSLEMGLAAADQADAESLKEGGEATLKMLVATMERFGVAEVDPEGEPFDPELHEAMTVQPSSEVEPGSVLTVFQKGYTLNGRLLRPARVVVAAEAAEAAEDS